MDVVIGVPKEAKDVVVEVHRRRSRTSTPPHTWTIDRDFWEGYNPQNCDGSLYLSEQKQLIPTLFN